MKTANPMAYFLMFIEALVFCLLLSHVWHALTLARLGANGLYLGNQRFSVVSNDGGKNDAPGFDMSHVLKVG